MVSKKIIIKNPTGLHLYPAGVLCNEASKFDCHIDINKNDISANAKSVLSVLGACIKMGDEITLVCSGGDETKALESLSNLLENEISSNDKGE